MQEGHVIPASSHEQGDSPQEGQVDIVDDLCILEKSSGTSSGLTSKSSLTLAISCCIIFLSSFLFILTSIH